MKLMELVIPFVICVLLIPPVCLAVRLASDLIYSIRRGWR